MTVDLINTVEAPTEFDPLINLRPGEPYFALVGRDKMAPPLVLEWADRNRSRARTDHGAGKIDDETFARELRKSTQAETVAWAMQAYKAGQPVDSPVESRANTTKESYSGHVLDPSTAARDKRQTDLARAAARVHNAIADMTEACATLREYNLHLAAGELTAFIGYARKTAEALTPKRPIEGVNNV